MNIMPMLPRKSVIYLINRRTDMAFDGAFLHKTVSELKEACDSHIDKIYQPSKDELVFLLRKKDFCKIPPVRINIIDILKFTIVIYGNT